MSQDGDPAAGLDATMTAPGATPRGTTAGGETSRDIPLVPGATLGRYVLIEAIGAGGMGMVFRARDPDLGREVAVKVLRGGDGTGGETLERRLLREAQAMATVSHDNLANVYDIGTSGGRVFVAMELVDGHTLRTLIADPTKTWRDKLAAVLSAGRGLAAAHSAGVIHRDFKPDNVLIAAKTGRVKVVDFGLARADRSTEPTVAGGASEPVLPPDLAAHLTQTGALLGTPAYMAPEQHAGEPVDARSDQFAFAVTAWEAIYGQRPFATDAYSSLVSAVRSHAIIPPPRASGVPTGLEAALRRALSPAATDRFTSMDALLGAIDHVIQPRRRAPWIVLGVGVVVVGGGVGVYAMTRDDAPANATAPVAGSSASTGSRAMVIQLDPDFDITEELQDDVEVSRAFQLAKIVEEKHDDLGRCYEKSRLDRQAVVKVAITIGENGQVKSARVADSDVPDSPLGSCAAAAVMTWQLPAMPGSGDAELEFPITFGQRYDVGAVRGPRIGPRFPMVDGITQVGPNQFIVMRSRAVELLGDPALYRSAKVVPGKDGEGVQFNDIKPGSAFDKIGMRSGDTILTLNDAPFTMQTDVRRVIESSQIGATLKLGLTRDREPVTIRVIIVPDDLSFPELGDLPGMDDFDFDFEPPVPPVPPIEPPHQPPTPAPTK